MNGHRENLADIIRQGVAVDFCHANEALSLDWFIGQQANQINKACYYVAIPAANATRRIENPWRTTKLAWRIRYLYHWIISQKNKHNAL